MGQETSDIGSASRNLEQEIEAIRGHLDELVTNLDRRVRSLVAPELHPVQIAAGVGVILLLVGGAIALAVVRRRKRQEFPEKVRRLRMALGRIIERPERVARSEPRIPMKILSSAGTAASSALAKRLVERAIKG
jgi:hypothetical protein